MDNALILALNFLELSLFDLTRQSAMTLVPQDMLLSNLLEGVLSEQELQQTLYRLEEVKNATPSLATAFRYANDLAQIFREKQRSHHYITAISASRHASEVMCLLLRIARSQVINHANVHLEWIDLFQHIQSLDIEPLPGQPTIIIVGAISEGSAHQQITVSPKNNTYLERRIEIVYNTTSSYPRLNLKLRSKRGSHDVKNERIDWIQRPFAAYDLKVSTFQDRIMGSIQTRLADLPYTVEGKQIRITIPHVPNTSVIETTIFDAHAKPLFRSIRLLTVGKILAREA